MEAAHLESAWPDLPLADWIDTRDTLHMWTQVAGKIKLAHTPLINHWWNAGLHVTARGLTSGTMYEGTRGFELSFDFIDHLLIISASSGERRSVLLRPCTVAQFYAEVRAVLHVLGIKLHVWTRPAEVPEPIPFEQDEVHRSYDPEYAQRFWRALLQADRVFNQFRARFNGKCSPVLFWWGTFDLAVTRFSGRSAPPREGADVIMREAITHEEISHGFWPGDKDTPEPMFYAYAAPEPPGIGEQPIRPEAAFYLKEKAEFFLSYSAVRQSSEPDRDLLEFMQSTYDAAAKLGNWDAALERKG